MAYVYEVKFFRQEDRLYIALFGNPTPIGEFWIKNVLAESLGIKEISQSIELEAKYSVQSLGIKPFPVSKPFFDFTDAVAKLAWERGLVLVMKAVP